MIEIKWIYTEFPLTGKDSLLPFIPVETMARAGGQPFANLATYKLATYGTGDFAGLSAITAFAPDFRTNLAWVIAEQELAGGNRGLGQAKLTRGSDYALIFSPEFTPVKGLDIKPLYSWWHADGITQTAARRNLVNVRSVGAVAGAGTAVLGSPGSMGGAPCPLGVPCTSPGDPTYHEDRHTIGLDARWRVGPFGLDPTIYYQWGTLESQALISTGAVKRVEADMSAWLIDLVGSYRTGPLLLELRAIYSTGNKARDNLAKRIRYFQPLDTDGAYYASWAAIMAL